MASSTDSLNQRTLPRIANGLREAVVRTKHEVADPGRPSFAAFLRQTSGHDFTSYSDLELRQRVAHMMDSSASPGDSDANTEVFAIVYEAVKRRLGAWRLFEPEQATDKFARYRELALAASESPARSEDIAGRLASVSLTSAERTLVDEMVNVAKRGRVDCWSDILLEADFYRDLSDIDTDGLMKFVPTDEQLITGHLLYQGSIVEMDSGEGKTVAAAFPAALHAIRGRAVHIITSNDYLAARDAEQLAPVYESLGITVGYVVGYMSDDERRHAYEQSIVYGTLREFAFDYLRDNLRMPNDPRAQRKLDVVIVDEADNGLIDQASTPLIISGEPIGNRRGLKKALAATEALVSRQMVVARELEAGLDPCPTDDKDMLLLVAKLLLSDPNCKLLSKIFAAHPKAYGHALALIDDESDEPESLLTAGLLYIVDPRQGSVRLTEGGHQYLEEKLGPVFDTSNLERELSANEGRSDIGAGERKRLNARLRRRINAKHGGMNQLHQLLKALVVLKRDVDYLVDDGKIVLIDDLTGRTLPDNIYNRGLQAAVQAKERVAVDPERETLAQISVQGFIKQYTTVAGLTGTAMDARDEFMSQYGLNVARVPSTRLRVRTDFGTRIYLSGGDKLAAIVDEISQCRLVGRPVLVATLTIEQSVRLSEMLSGAGIPHEVLNAANDATEARIVRQAGTVGAVTLATNMAGRGTDIVLQPGLNDRIVEGYVGHVLRLLDEGIEHVRLDCSSTDECSLISTAFSAGGNESLPWKLETDHAGLSLFVSEIAGPMRTPGIVVEFGLGLHVIGTELNESSRIDRQLRGRSGRQGAPGTTRFIVSMEDQLLAHRRTDASYTGHAPKRDAAGRLYHDGSEVQRHVLRMQGQLSDDEAADRDMLNDYMRIQESQAVAYYAARREVFDVDSFHDNCRRYVRDVAHSMVEEFLPDLGISDYLRHFQQLSQELSTDFGVDIIELEGLSAIDLPDSISDVMMDALDEMRACVGGPRLDALERQLFLQTSDEHWRDHIGNMQELMLSVSFTGHDRKHTAAEYTLRSHKAYESIKNDIVDDFLRRLFRFPFDELIQLAETPRVLQALDEEIAEILV